ncbi:MAG: hypothetical protein IJ019_03735 [Alphaproteobacteria bacterium]|nr:hypothetical protein [Alphaproteobacteria bacterium]
MNKFLLSTLLTTTVIFSSVVNANEYEKSIPDHPVHMQIDKDFHKKIAQEMATNLDLTQEQQEQAKQIREKGQEEIKPLMNQMKELRKKLDEKRKANMEEFEKILNADQKKKFEEMKKRAPKNRVKLHMRRGMHKNLNEKSIPPIEN